MTQQIAIPKDYNRFLYRKLHEGAGYGFDPISLPDTMFDFQKALVEWAPSPPAPLLQLAHYLRHDLRQAHLDALDPPTLLTLAGQFQHWALACEEAFKRPKSRSLAKDAPPLPPFTLTAPATTRRAA